MEDFSVPYAPPVNPVRICFAPKEPEGHFVALSWVLSAVHSPAFHPRHWEGYGATRVGGDGHNRISKELGKRAGVTGQHTSGSH